MQYEIWDVETGNCIGRYLSSGATATRIRTLLDHVGRDYAHDLQVTAEDEAGKDHGPWTADQFLAMVEELPAAS